MPYKNINICRHLLLNFVQNYLTIINKIFVNIFLIFIHFIMPKREHIIGIYINYFRSSCNQRERFQKFGIFKQLFMQGINCIITYTGIFRKAFPNWFNYLSVYLYKFFVIIREFKFRQKLICYNKILLAVSYNL